MKLDFTGTVIEWRGPAPFYFVRVPDEPSAAIEAASKQLTYGWGAIPASVAINATEWSTSLFPKDGGYLVPLKDRIRKGEGIEPGDTVSITLTLAM